MNIVFHGAKFFLFLSGTHATSDISTSTDTHIILTDLPPNTNLPPVEWTTGCDEINW